MPASPRVVASIRSQLTAAHQTVQPWPSHLIAVHERISRASPVESHRCPTTQDHAAAAVALDDFSTVPTDESSRGRGSRRRGTHVVGVVPCTIAIGPPNHKSKQHTHTSDISIRVRNNTRRDDQDERTLIRDAASHRSFARSRAMRRVSSRSASSCAN